MPMMNPAVPPPGMNASIPPPNVPPPSTNAVGKILNLHMLTNKVTAPTITAPPPIPPPGVPPPTATTDASQ